MNWEEHPDLALLRYGNKRGVCCLVVHGVSDAQSLCLPGMFCGYCQGEYTAFLCAQEDGFTLEAAESVLRSKGLCAGVSGPFALAASARGCMHKARLALLTGCAAQPGRTLYPMDKFAEAALVRAVDGALQAQGFSPADFCDPALWQMAATDEKRDTCYVESLYAYLRCGMDLKLAAGQLGVHRNTLAYRMERVQALFALDLKDESRCFELLFSLWLWHSLPHEHVSMQDAFDMSYAQAALWGHVERCAAAAQGGMFACALLAVGAADMADNGREELLGKLRACVPQQTALAYDEDVIFAALPPEEMAGFEEQACTLCAQYGCPMVIAGRFPAKRLDRQAAICRMALCAAQDRVTRTRDICSTLLFMAVERVTPLAPYLCEDVIRVMDDDAQKGTALSRSLYAYLLHFSDLRRAAGQIGMHRNTMEYHIRKIDALIGSDMDGARRFQMMCTYKMLALPEMGRYGLK